MTKRKSLFVTIGIPASGKSTWISRRRSATVISPDEIRKELYDDYQKGISSPAVWNEAYSRLEKCLKEKNECIFDATNTIPSHRAPIIKRGKEAGANVIAVFFPIDVRFAIYRNSKRRPREKRVPNHVIHHYHDMLVPPTKNEGFDSIVVRRQLPTVNDCKGMGGTIIRNKCEICDRLELEKMT